MREATSTCSSTGIGRYCFVSQSKNASLALLNAPIAVTCAPPRRSFAAKSCRQRIAAVLQDDREGAFAVRLMKQFALHALPPCARGPERRALSVALEVLDGA